MPVAAARQPPPALHLHLGSGAGDQGDAVAVFGVGGLLGRGQLFSSRLGCHEGLQEGSGVAIEAAGRGKAPGRTGGVSVVVEIEMLLRAARKANEAVNGAGGQGDKNGDTLQCHRCTQRQRRQSCPREQKRSLACPHG